MSFGIVFNDDVYENGMYGFNRSGKSLEELSNYQLLIEDSVPWNMPLRHQSPEEILIHYLMAKYEPDVKRNAL